MEFYNSRTMKLPRNPYSWRHCRTAPYNDFSYVFFSLLIAE